MEIQRITSELDDIGAVYGFGSFFRGKNYKDIDLLVVATSCCKSHLNTYYDFRSIVTTLGLSLGILFDITFLTTCEYQERPLLEMDYLVSLYHTQETVYAGSNL